MTTQVTFAAAADRTTVHQDAPADKNLALIGGGISALAVLSGMIKEARAQKHLGSVAVTIYENGAEIGPGLPYASDLPMSFILNHETSWMGSVNAAADELDERDFFNWVQEHKQELTPLYPGFNLENPGEYVPRTLYGRYLKSRYEEMKTLAEKYGIHVIERASTHVNNIQKQGEKYAVTTASGDNTHFDAVVMTTGNSFKPFDTALREGFAFHAYPFKSYMNYPAIADGSTMLIRGTGLSAYDVAIEALESGKFSKVTMASRNGMLREVRGPKAAYTRQHFTYDKLDQIAGPGQPFTLAMLLTQITAEFNHAGSTNGAWRQDMTAEETIAHLRDGVNSATRKNEFRWRSMLSSLDYDERARIYLRMSPADREVLHSRYQSRLLNFFAPAPLPNARKILRFIDEGKLEIVPGYQGAQYDAGLRKFVAVCLQTPEGRPTIGHTRPISVKTKTIEADVFIAADGINHDVRHVPIYQRMIANGLVEINPEGGTNYDPVTLASMTQAGVQQNLFLLGSVLSGQAIQPINSIIISRYGRDIGKRLVETLMASSLKPPIEMDHDQPDAKAVPLMSSAPAPVLPAS